MSRRYLGSFPCAWWNVEESGGKPINPWNDEKVCHSLEVKKPLEFGEVPKDGLWFGFQADYPDPDRNDGRNVLLSRGEVQRLHRILAEWLNGGR